MSEARVIVDQTERDLAAKDLGTTYIVEAAAGTGKTTLLVERILTIIREKQLPLAQIVAITFTEKAAGELKIKLRTKLEERARSEPHLADRWRHALLELDSMPVSTIHSFCRELIQERPVEAGVDANFTVADQPTADLLRSDVWQEWIAREFGADCPAARPFLERGILPAATRGFSLRDVYDLLLNYHEDLAALHVQCLSDDEWQERLAQFVLGMENDLTILDACADPIDGLAQELRKAADWIERAPALSGPLMVDWLEHPPTLSGQRGQQGNWSSKDAQKLAQELRRSFPDRVREIYSHVVSRWAQEMVEWLKGAAKAYSEAKVQAGLLDFQDLLLFARNMLRDNRSARDFFKRRFAYVLVDEFQDTDPLQAEIAFYLAERADNFAPNWEDVELVPGKLFIVGDPKQSIYRFRRADLDLYGKVRTKIEACGRCLHIRLNFRSVPDILHEVNEVFAPQMTGARNGRYEPQYVALEAFRDEKTARPQTVFLPPPGWWDDKLSAKQQAEAEAACIAEYIRELCGTDDCSFRDIGILYSTTTYLLELENALRAREIPYQVAGGKKLIERGEVIALRTVVAALDNPFDEISVVGALRSPFFACSDEDLVQQRLGNAGFNYMRDAGQVPYLEQCFAILRDLHQRQSGRSPSETLTELFERTKGLQVYALKPQGESRVANLLKLLDLARTLESGPAGSFHALAQRLMKLEEARVGEEDSVSAETGDDVVQLLTFHKAKGLEFPVVILFRLGLERDVKDTVIVRRGTKTLDFRAGKGFETSGFAAARADETDRAECEAMRLLYVAMTRAREQLVIPAYWAGSDRGFYNLLATRYPPDGRMNVSAGASRFEVHDTGKFNLETAPTEALKMDVDLPESSPVVQASLARRTEWQTSRTRAAESLVRVPSFAAPSSHDDTAPLVGGTPERRQDALNFGAFVHRLMELVSLPDGGNVEAIAASIADECGVRGAMIPEGCSLVRAALRSGLFQRVSRAERRYRELPYTDLQNGVLWDGFMDLVFIEDGRAVIVDYKTDRVSYEDAPVFAENYRDQLSAYQRAFEKITGMPVGERLIYFLRADRVVSVPVAT